MHLQPFTLQEQDGEPTQCLHGECILAWLLCRVLPLFLFLVYRNLFAGSNFQVLQTGGKHPDENLWKAGESRANTDSSNLQPDIRALRFILLPAGIWTVLQVDQGNVLHSSNNSDRGNHRFYGVSRRQQKGENQVIVYNFIEEKNITFICLIKNRNIISRNGISGRWGNRLRV